MFFKKLGVIFVRIFYCVLPFLHLLEESGHEVEDDKQVEQDKKEPEEKPE